MKQIKLFYPPPLLFAFFCGLMIAGIVHAETVKIGGTGFALGVMHKLAEAYQNSHPKEKIIVIPSLGSSGGIKALLQGALEIAVSGRPLNASESGKGIHAEEFARSPFIFIVNKTITQKSITLRELENIYQGKTVAWPDGTRIRPVLRPETDTVTRTLRGISPALDRALTSAMSREGMIRAITDQESAESVEKIAGALAGCTLTQVYSENRQVGILAFNGVAPSLKGISNGSYPLYLSLYLVTPVKIQKSTKKFVDFIFSEDGRSILAANGNMVIHDAMHGKQ